MLTALCYLHSFLDDMSGRVRKQLIWLLFQKHSSLITALISAHSIKESVRNLTLGFGPWSGPASAPEKLQLAVCPCHWLHVTICLLSTTFYNLRMEGVVLQPFAMVHRCLIIDTHLPRGSCLTWLCLQSSCWRAARVFLKADFPLALPTGQRATF